MVLSTSIIVAASAFSSSDKKYILLKILEMLNKYKPLLGYKDGTIETDMPYEIKEEDNVIRVCYVKRDDMSYTVKYLDKANDEELFDSEVRDGKTFEDKFYACDEISIMLRCRILTDVKLAEDFLKLVFLIDVIVILKHGEGKCLAETARANEEEILVGFFYLLYERSLVHIVTILFYDILKILHAVWYALAINALWSYYHNSV